jgi:hypothetical protein
LKSPRGREEQEMAVKLQKNWRGQQARKDVKQRREIYAQKLQEENEAAIKLQSQYRAKQAREEAALKKRKRDAEEKERKRREAEEKELRRQNQEREEDYAAVKLQTQFRGKKAREELRSRKEAYSKTFNERGGPKF